MLMFMFFLFVWGEGGGLGFRVAGLSFRAEGLRFRIQVSGLRA